MKRQFVDFRLGRRAAALAGLYGIIAAVSLYIAYEIRFDFIVPPEYQQERLRLLWLVVGIKVVVLYSARQMESMITFFGVRDFFRLNGALLVSAVLLIALRFVGLDHLSPPRGILLIDYLVCLAALCSFRLSARMFRERFLMGKKLAGQRLEDVVIIGAGDTGASLASDLINMPARGLNPVAFLDDDSNKHGQSIHGIVVEGSPEELPEIARLGAIRRAIIAMPSASAKRISEIALFYVHRGVKTETVPALEDLATGRARASRIRPVEIHDLLGRSVVELDARSIRQFVENKVVMVTGAGGSIGAELCRQIVQLNSRQLVAVDQSEPSVFFIEQELSTLGYAGTVVTLVADVLDSVRMRSLFATYAPQIVFHAAAHKHVHLMERQPSEAIKNNAIGTRKLAEIAIAYGAEAFVLISTDKAINPTSVMGASKRLAELHLQALHTMLGDGATIDESRPQVRSTVPVRVEASSEPTLKSQGIFAPQTVEHTKVQGGAAGEKGTRRTKLMAVRFGNVLGSSGSVVPIFKKQIEAGGPVTVTHPEVTRYFMVTSEAVGLVLQASVLGSGGEIFVLDMGEPVKIVKLAETLIELSGFKVHEDIEIKFTGLKPGEKLFEELQHHSEAYISTGHPRIKRFVNSDCAKKSSQMAIEELEPFVDEIAANEIKRGLKLVIPEYEPYIE